MYGDLKQAAGHYGGSQGRRWKVDWNRTPQPIQVKIGCLRGIRDKLPGYCLCEFQLERENTMLFTFSLNSGRSHRQEALLAQFSLYICAHKWPKAPFIHSFIQ